MKKTRVLCAIGTMSGGGSERQMLGVLQHLDRRQFAPELYIISHTGELLPEVPEDVPIHSFEHRHPEPVGKLPGAGFRARIQDLAKLLDEREIDVIYDRTYHMTLITAGATKIRPTPRVSVIVADPRLDFETNPERFRWIKRRLLRKAYQTADRVLAVSEGVRLAALDYHDLSAQKVQTAYNFFDIETIDRRSRQPLPSSLPREEGRFRVVAAGRLHVQKGFDLLIEATRLAVWEMGHQQLVVWILGTGQLKSELSRQIQQANLQDHVRLLGFQDNPLRFFHGADLFCLSSRYEGMPNALVEAILCGTPVVSTDCPSGPREILQGGTLGRLVPVENPVALAESITDAILHPSAWKSTAVIARQQAQETFSLAEGIGRTAQILNEVSGVSNN